MTRTEHVKRMVMSRILKATSKGETYKTPQWLVDRHEKNIK